MLNLIGLAMLVLCLWAARNAMRSGPGAITRFVQQVLGGSLVAIGIGLLLKGNMISALVCGGIGLALQYGPAIGWPPRIPWPSTTRGRSSRVETAHLVVQVNDQTGRMRGQITKGFFAGRTIESLRPVELVHLWQDCRLLDVASAHLLEAHLNRVHATWRDDLARAEAQAQSGPGGKMRRAEAFEILGLKDGAAVEDIRRAHRELMLKMHPDRGGSNYLAAKINEAKDVALGAN